MLSGASWRVLRRQSENTQFQVLRKGRQLFTRPLRTDEAGLVPLKWSAFSSSSTRLAASQAVGLAPANAVIFKINVTTGKVIKALSFFEEEGEVLLWPGQKFQVTRPAYVGEGGYTFVDMSENAVLDMLVF